MTTRKQKTRNEALAAALTVSERKVFNEEIPNLTHRAFKAADGKTSKEIAARMVELGWAGIKQGMAGCEYITPWDFWRDHISEPICHPITYQTAQISDPGVSSATFFLARTMAHWAEHKAQAVFAELTGGHPLAFEIGEMQNKSPRGPLLYDLAPDRNAQLIFNQWRGMVNASAAADYLAEAGHNEEAIRQRGKAIAADEIGARLVEALPDGAESVLPYIRGKGAEAFNEALVERLNALAA